jgi:hypothetical protein
MAKPTSDFTKFRNGLFKSQGGRCALCSQKVRKADMWEDWDPETDELRSLMHNGCRLLIMEIEANWDLLDAAKAYLLRHGAEMLQEVHG